MKFGLDSKKGMHLGEEIGFLFGFVLFASIFYTILRLLHKIPPSVDYVYVLFGVSVVYFLRMLYMEWKK